MTRDHHMLQCKFSDHHLNYVNWGFIIQLCGRPVAHNEKKSSQSAYIKPCQSITMYSQDETIGEYKSSIREKTVKFYGLNYNN